MSFEQFLTDEQDPKPAEKVLGKLQDMLAPGERILFLAVQKKPAVTLMPDAIIATDKRIVFCSPGNLGLTTNFQIFLWKDVKEVSFKEEFFGARFTMVPLKGENVTVDYIPKVQARKLYQFSSQQIEEQGKLSQQSEAISAITAPVQVDIQGETIAPAPAPLVEEEDELTQKLKKLKGLFEKQLISQEEYETKKADILSQL
ncbi:PH domain-containing protein [Pedobacter sp. SYSU D00535]|uniref:PH domain-containing protein n=1 Tax=Pedobacter sp. SYSU D00535 TaxID=2810308 RepID=UPI001A9653D2|nr:PH domain-containing protein [Pedobacter sp. SYSU D00535]